MNKVSAFRLGKEREMLEKISQDKFGERHLSATIRWLIRHEYIAIVDRPSKEVRHAKPKRITT
jgi:hypothetical protein